MGVLMTLAEFLPVRRELRERGVKLVWTNGCFDLLHAGHLQSLRLAREQGDALLVGLNSDASVRDLKNPDRPFVGERDRAAMLCALAAVDYVVIFGDKRCDGILEQVRPDIMVKGADYTLQTLNQEERAAVERHGGEIRFIPLVPGLSTTNLVKKIRRCDPEKVMSGAFAFIRDEKGRLLLVANNYSEGVRWGLPGGGHNRGERLEETVVREAREETGLEVRVRRYCGLIERISPELNLHLLCHQFEAEAVGGTLHVRPDEEHVIEARYCTPDEIRAIAQPVLGRKYILQYLENPAAYPSLINMGEGEE